jgi:cell division protein FtsN
MVCTGGEQASDFLPGNKSVRRFLMITKSVRRALTVRKACAAMTLLGTAGFLAACSETQPDMSIPLAQQEANYRAHAKSWYEPPGPPEDPWGPYIVEASRRFDVPETWIRSVIHRESGGKLYHNGQLVRSGPGAMGLMQLMPPTYDEMKLAYNLGDDPFNPRDNIFAGTAYIRQMYDIYGSPGFLAAYNAGPGRLEDFLTRHRTLPRETRLYVSAIGHQIAGIVPNNRSQADLMVAQHETGVQYASATESSRTTRTVSDAWKNRIAGGSTNQPVQVAAAPEDGVEADVPAYVHDMDPVEKDSSSADSVRAAWSARQNDAAAQGVETTVQKHSVHFIAPVDTSRASHNVQPAVVRSASATAPFHAASGGDWSVQVGAFRSASQAMDATVKARSGAGGTLSGAQQKITSVSLQNGKLYRARLTGLSRSSASAACSKIRNCLIVPPGSA